MPHVMSDSVGPCEGSSVNNSTVQTAPSVIPSAHYVDPSFPVIFSDLGHAKHSFVAAQCGTFLEEIKPESYLN